MPQFRQRQLLILAAAFFLVLIVVPRLHRSHGSGLSDKQKAARTQDALNLIDRGERHYFAGHGRYTSHIADLLPANGGLADDLAIGLAAQIDVSSDGKTYLAQVAGSVLSFVRARRGEKITAQSCTVLKSGSGIKCA
jgi:hypothetical protein